MFEPQDVARAEWCVVLNGEEQYAIWPDARDLPAGWRAEGTRGARERCLARVQEVWTDPCPAGLRRRAAEGLAVGGADGVASAVGRQACRIPGAEAVRGDGFALTFGELDAASNRWARYLRSLGAGRGAVVGVLLGRGAGLHAVTLGVWKAGAACLPLDPESPTAARALLGVAGARFLVTEMPYGPGDFAGRVRYADDPEVCGALARLPDEPLGGGPDPGDVAYVTRVPGADGLPLAVEVTHRGLAHHLASLEREFDGTGGGGTAVFGSVASEAAVTGLWAPLWAGRRVLLAPRALDPEGSGEWLAADGPFALLSVTPDQIELLARQLGCTAGDRLARRFVVAGGAPGPAAARLAGLLGPGRLRAVYGAAETSFGPFLTPAAGPDGGTRLLVLDDAFRPVPDGAVGELYVAGPGVARGYAGRAALTARRFPPDPCGPPGARMFRTGEPARRTGTGEVRLLGRTDRRQVWVRGHRTDPAEAEEALHDHPGVAEAVVVAVEDAPDDVRLAAYVVPRPGGRGPAPAALEDHCARRLPAHLVPASVTLLDEVPRGADGRVARSALPGAHGRPEGCGRSEGDGRPEMHGRPGAHGWPEVHGRPEGYGRGGRFVTGPGPRPFPGGSGLVEALAAHRVPGACFALLEGGRLVAVEAAGSDGAGRPITPRTAFPAGRLSGHVAALGALRLVDQGLLAPDAEAGRAGDAPVTLADLLCRRRAGAAAAPPAALLATLLENVTGEAFGPLLRRLVLGPLGLDGSCFGAPPPRSGDGDGAPVARVGHDAAGRVLPGAERAGDPAQLWSTVTDLAKVAGELRRSLRGAPFGRDVAACGATPRPDGPHGAATRAGTPRSERVRASDTAPPGYYAASVFCPRADRGLVVLANGSAGERVGRELAARLNARTSYDGRAPDDR
ncbi:AMP-binding protein [Streptomyces huiliensis]|uniref:AMP-binding protein n=1 Tax=Streptomyces huiliensis TaxID=2876027 RepID=UPI001CBFC258|nr:AMP-binding protein [Streptomyces huiliensis]MBZ4320830.1 AMP-binding protein [Streptomyces huiliensis]